MKNTALSVENEDGFPELFSRVVEILEQARSHAARSINHYMVLAYWQIGKGIIQEQQQGKSRADYGQRVIESLSQRLTHHYGRGFSVTSLKYFRTFYQVYGDRTPEIGRQAGDQFEKGRQTGGESFKGFHPIRPMRSLNFSVRDSNAATIFVWSSRRSTMNCANSLLVERSQI